MVLGCTFGALAGGELMKLGRRRVQFINIFVGLIGTGITAVFSYPTILVGRFLYGFSAGSFSCTLPRFIEEVIPLHIYDTLATVFYFSQTAGTLAAYFLGEILPNDDEALKNTPRWRVFYFYFPGGLYLLVLLAFIFTIKHDSIKHLIIRNNLKEARLAVMEVYKHSNESNVDDYIARIRNQCGEDTSGLTIKDALVHPRYRTATWANIGYITFHELTGINVILIYSAQIFAEMHDSGSKITPRIGVYVTGIVNFLAALLSS